MSPYGKDTITTDYIAGLLGRISELEDVLEMESENRTSMTARIEELEASLKLLTEFGYWKGRAEQAEAALAERDRMLRLAVELLAGMVSDHGPRDVTEDEVLADLKARAEGGRKDV